MATKYQDYYKMFGLERNATAKDIKKAYRKLARKYHPDINKEKTAEENFKKVTEAYEVLKDPEKRKLYDQLGDEWKNGQDFKPPPEWKHQHFDTESDQGEFNNSKGFSDFFEALFRANTGQQGPGQQGHSINGMPKRYCGEVSPVLARGYSAPDSLR